jgi:ubiquitin C-terminal hydrolase
MFPSDKSSSLQQCVDDFFDIEKVDGWKCDKCLQIVTANKRVRLWCPPKILVVATPPYLFGRKLKYNEKLSLGKHGPMGRQSWEYELRSMAFHQGSLASGHYVALVKGTTWTLIDDDVVQDIDDITINRHGNVYLSFYEIAPSFKQWVFKEQPMN